MVFPHLSLDPPVACPQSVTVVPDLEHTLRNQEKCAVIRNLLLFGPVLGCKKLSGQRFRYRKPCQSHPILELAESVFQVVVRKPSDATKLHLTSDSFVFWIVYVKSVHVEAAYSG